MSKIVNTMTYTINNGQEIAKQVDYADGRKVRTVKSINGKSRKEIKTSEGWKEIKQDATEHILKNGYVAIKNGKHFDIYKDGNFLYETERLKFAKRTADSNGKE